MNSIYKQICNNIIRGIPFRVNKIGLFQQYDPFLDINYKKDESSKKILNSFTNISLKLYREDYSFSYIPPLNIYDGLCQQYSSKDLWSFKELNVKDYCKAEPISVKDNKELDNIPCFKLYENIIAEEVLVTDWDMDLYKKEVIISNL